MKNFFLSVFILSIFLLAFFLESCTLFSGVGSKSSVHKRSNSLVEIAAPVTSSESNYSVAIITDVHFGEEGNRSVDEKFITWLKNFSSGTEPKFIICLGDIGQGGAKSEFDAYNNFVNRVKSVTGIPTYTILGNHDLYKNEWNYFKETVFPHTTFFHFKSKSFSWYFLDTGNLTLGINQYTALEKALKNDNSQKLIFSHIPLYSNGEFYASPQDTIERNLLISLFKKTNVKMYFAGHTHNYSCSDIGFIEYVVPGFLEKEQWALLKINENSSNLDVTICP